MTDHVKIPVFRQHTWKQECDIANGREVQNLPKPVISYQFTGKQFVDKVSKENSYD